MFANLLGVVLAALYFSPGPDPRDMNPMPAITTAITSGIGVRTFS
jgi:hypothetical protein